ncbi:hypothetical protein D9Q98_009221 [Chlorella vulgaris]|uniref:Uncharacterized protein n=1 Tax=Chlorella vulgaris TaxID=3077 RepID=A0A9D4YWX3_CHLVU|nr:hypothetical protein D9Q98_009221 [Chlorella vulgaris]
MPSPRPSSALSRRSSSQLGLPHTAVSSSAAVWTSLVITGILLWICAGACWILRPDDVLTAIVAPKMRAESATTRIEPVVRQELRRALEARSGGGTAAADGQLALEEEASLIAAASGAEPVATEVTIIMALKHRKGASKRGNLLSDAAISAALALGHTA